MYSDYKIAVIGDVMRDVWVRGEVARLSPEAPVPVILNPETEYSLGGAGNVAANIASLGAEAHLYGQVSERDVLFEDLYIKANILDYCDRSDKKSTTEKKRIIADGQQICRIDIEDIAPIDEMSERYLMNELQQALVEEIAHDVSSVVAYNAFIIADYNKGVMTPAFINSVMDLAKKHGIPVMVDPKFDNFWEYKGATIFKPNEAEYEAQKHKFDHKLALGQAYLCEYFVLTLGDEGIWAFAQDRRKRIPAHPVAVADTTGAGDTVMAVLTLEYLRTGDIFKAAELANYAGSLAVQVHGTAQLTQSELWIRAPVHSGVEPGHSQI